jgi:DNA-directed RNA polymerase specialized sigma subunit
LHFKPKKTVNSEQSILASKALKNKNAKKLLKQSLKPLVAYLVARHIKILEKKLTKVAYVALEDSIQLYNQNKTYQFGTHFSYQAQIQINKFLKRFKK